MHNGDRCGQRVVVSPKVTETCRKVTDVMVSNSMM